MSPGSSAAYRDGMVKALVAFIPSLGVQFLFVVVLNAMLEGDRRERAAQARFEREQDERARRAADERG